MRLPNRLLAGAALLVAATCAQAAPCSNLDPARWLLGQWAAESGDKRILENWREVSATIDELYGLEPVYEPGVVAGRAASPIEVVVVTCPYCWEQYETQVDLTGGSSTYVEDCQVCCQPIELSLVVSDSGALVALLPNRMD